MTDNTGLVGFPAQTLETSVTKVPGGGPATPSISYSDHFLKWELIRDLLGGTGAMRSAAYKWLPMEEKERYPQYLQRLGRTFLYNGLGNSVGRIVSKPFSKSVVLKGSLPEQLKAIESDSDFEGTDLTQFFRNVFEVGVQYGLCHVLVDYPAISRPTLDAQRRFNIHPYFKLVHPLDLIGYKFDKDPFTHKPFLTQIRVRETDIREDPDYGETKVNVILEWNSDGSWVRYFSETESDWKVLSEGTHTFSGRVPMATFYSKKLGFMTAEPPLMDLAWLNLAHWQSSSEQRNILRVARFPILHETGISPDQANEPVVLGPFNAVRSTDPDAKLSWVEHTGKAIGSGEKDLETLKTEMEIMGLQPFVQPAVRSRTATEVVGIESRTMTSVQAWIRGLENTISQCFNLAAAWSKEIIPEDFSVDVFNEFGLSFKAEQDMRALDAARSRGDIDQKTYLQELVRRQVVSSEMDIDAVMEQSKKEQPTDSPNRNSPLDTRIGTI